MPRSTGSAVSSIRPSSIDSGRSAPVNVCPHSHPSLTPEFEPARPWLEGVGPPDRISIVPGNHDAYVRATRHRFAETLGDYFGGDDAAGNTSPSLRRRGPLALIGVSSAVPTAPLMATGWLGRSQLEALERLLVSLAGEPLFRVLLIHHPLRSDARAKRL